MGAQGAMENLRFLWKVYSTYALISKGSQNNVFHQEHIHSAESRNWPWATISFLFFQSLFSVPFPPRDIWACIHDNKPCWPRDTCLTCEGSMLVRAACETTCLWGADLGTSWMTLTHDLWLPRWHDIIDTCSNHSGPRIVHYRPLWQEGRCAREWRVVYVCFRHVYPSYCPLLPQLTPLPSTPSTWPLLTCTSGQWPLK